MEHKTHEELQQMLAEAAKLVEVGAKYCHYKHPEQYYIVRSLVVIEATEEVGVVYEAQYGGRIPFLRPLKSFLDVVEKDGVKVPRFSKL